MKGGLGATVRNYHSQRVNTVVTNHPPGSTVASADHPAQLQGWDASQLLSLHTKVPLSRGYSFLHKQHIQSQNYIGKILFFVPSQKT